MRTHTVYVHLHGIRFSADLSSILGYEGGLGAGTG